MKRSKVIIIYLTIFLLLIITALFNEGMITIPEPTPEEVEPEEVEPVEVEPEEVEPEEVEPENLKTIIDPIEDVMPFASNMVFLFAAIMMVAAIFEAVFKISSSEDSYKVTEEVTSVSSSDEDEDDECDGELECVECYMSYEEFDSNSVRPEKYCSLTCQKDSMADNTELNTYECKWCDREFIYKDSNAYENKRYCSRPCERNDEE